MGWKRCIPISREKAIKKLREIGEELMSDELYEKSDEEIDELLELYANNNKIGFDYYIGEED